MTAPDGGAVGAKEARDEQGRAGPRRGRIHLVPLLLGEGTPLFAGERGELIPEGKPVTGAVTHLRYRVAKP